MRKLLSCLVLVALLSVAACITPAVSAEEVRSSQPRLTPTVLPADFKTLVDGNTAFALDLYKQLRTAAPNDDLFYSPYSVSEALAMTYAGARGGTEKSMAQSLNFTLPQDRLHPAFNSLDLQLKQRGQGAKGKDGAGFRLRVVNAIWGQKDYTFLEQFLDVLAQNYGAGLRILDFIKETEPSRIAISESILRLRVMSAFFRPAMNRE